MNHKNKNYHLKGDLQGEMKDLLKDLIISLEKICVAYPSLCAQFGKNNVMCNSLILSLTYMLAHAQDKVNYEQLIEEIKRKVAVWKELDKTT